MINPMTSQNPSKPAKKDSLLLNLLVNILIPTVILSKFSGEDKLGVEWAIIIALAFPIGYGIREVMRSGKFSLFSILGIFSVAMTGGMALLELPPKYIIIKEAAIPAIFAIATLLSMKTRYPLVKTFLYNDTIMQVDKVSAALKVNQSENAFEGALKNASYLMALSFIVSSILNYILAKIILVSAPGTEAFNAELGKMNALSIPVIAIPATIVMMFALFYLFKQIKKLTKLELEDILITQ